MILRKHSAQALAENERRATMEKSATRTGDQQRRIQSRIDDSDRARAKNKKSDICG